MCRPCWRSSCRSFSCCSALAAPSVRSSRPLRRDVARNRRAVFVADRVRGAAADSGHGDGAARDVQRHPAFRVRAAAARHPWRVWPALVARARAAHAARSRPLPLPCLRSASRRRSSTWPACIPTSTRISIASRAASRARATGSCSTTGALSFKQASLGLTAKIAELDLEKPAGRRWKLAVCGPHRSPQVELGPDFETTWDPKDADFALMLGEFYCAQVRRAAVGRGGARRRSLCARL